MLDHVSANTLEVASVRLSRDLRFIHEAYARVPARWNPSAICLVRILLTRPLRDNVEAASSMRGFLRRAHFDIAGAYTKTERIFRAALGDIERAADEFHRNRTITIGRAIIENHAGFQLLAKVHPRVHDSTLAERPLEICFHQRDAHDYWPGIATMLADLGGTNIRKRSGVSGLGYGSLEIDHARSLEIARHPLVRQIDVVSEISLR